MVLGRLRGTVHALAKRVCSRQPVGKRVALYPHEFMPLKQVLIVDDNREVRTAFGAVLNLDGYGVVLAANGKDAVTEARERCPAAILMDIDMPVMSGLEAAEALKNDELTKNIPIVAVTGREFVEAMPWRSLFAAYIQKPIGARELMTTLERLIGPPDSNQAAP